MVKLPERPPPLTKYIKGGTVICKEWPMFSPVKLSGSVDA